MIEYTAHITSQEPVTEDLRADINKAISDVGSTKQLVTSLQRGLEATNSKVDNSNHYAVDLINKTQAQLCDLHVLYLSDSGVVEVKRQPTCYKYGYPQSDGQPVIDPPTPKYARAQIRLTLHSDFDLLQQQFVSLSSRLSQLEVATRIRPIPDHQRKQGATLYPQYGDWLLTSDKSEQGISFSGLRAEIGRSIYIQTRRQAYLYVNGHSFYGLSGVSTSQDQWLSSNTTYRFVRYSSTTWLVTASSSPYPLT